MFTVPNPLLRIFLNSLKLNSSKKFFMTIFHIKKSKIHGKGIFAAQNIKKGEVSRNDL